MGRPAGWMQKLTGRGAMRSPGAPSLRREIERMVNQDRNYFAAAMLALGEADVHHDVQLPISVAEIELTAPAQVGRWSRGIEL